MQWTPEVCEPNSMTTSAERQDVHFFGNITDARPGEPCFYYATGTWTAPIDRDRLRSDAANTSRVKLYSDCTLVDLAAPDLMRWLLRRAPHSRTGLAAARVQHAQCKLPDPADPYGLLVLFTAGRGRREVPVLQLHGDSFHRNVFAAVVATMRGSFGRPWFDRQSHDDMAYVVTATGDAVYFTRPDKAVLDDALLVVHYRGVWDGRTVQGVPLSVAPPPDARSLLLVGGLNHMELPCKLRLSYMATMRGYAKTLAEYAQYPGRAAVVVIKTGVLSQGHGNEAHHAWKNHLYRGIANEAVRDRSDARVLLLDDVQLANAAPEGSGEGAPLDEELLPADKLHFACVMHERLPHPVGGWRLERKTCRGWHDVAHVVVLAAMLGAAAP